MLCVWCVVGDVYGTYKVCTCCVCVCVCWCIVCMVCVVYGGFGMCVCMVCVVCFVCMCVIGRVSYVLCVGGVCVWRGMDAELGQGREGPLQVENYLCSCHWAEARPHSPEQTVHLDYLHPHPPGSVGSGWVGGRC